MNLALLFEPTRALPFEPDAAPAGTLAARAAVFRPGPFPTDWMSMDIVVFGIPDNRDSASDDSAFDPTGPDAIRARLYPLTTGTGAWRVADLGNLRPGPTPADTAERLAEVVAVLRRHNVLPIILGGSHALTVGQHGGYEYGPDGATPHDAAAPPVRAAVVDRGFDVADTGPAAATWLRELLLREPNHLLTLSHLASQRYHVTSAEAAALEKMYFDVVRLGALHGNLRTAEPLLRGADWLSIDVAACAHAAIPQAPGAASPFGLSAEQLSQLTWYAGLSRQLSSVGFYSYQPAQDPLSLGAMTLATAIWHLIEGYYHRPRHAPREDSADYIRHDIPLADSTETLVFYQHHQTEQWWLLVEPPAAAAHLLPCAEADFQAALHGEIPNCWVQALARS